MVERIVEKVVEKVIKVPTREKLPRNRTSRTFEFRVADCKGFVTVGEYADGRPGEIFLRISKQGSTLAGIMDAFAISVSYGLQYGVPLRVYVETLTNTRFEPAGMTDDPDLRIASSILDYIFRRLAVDYLTLEERSELNILTTGERTQPTLPGVEETVTETRQGTDIPADPPSLDASSPLLDDLSDAPKELSLLERAGVTDPAPAKPVRGHPAEGQPQRRPVLHAVRRPDAAGRLLPRLPQLRQHQRLQLRPRRGEDHPRADRWRCPRWHRSSGKAVSGPVDSGDDVGDLELASALDDDRAGRRVGEHASDAGDGADHGGDGVLALSAGHADDGEASAHSGGLVGVGGQGVHRGSSQGGCAGGGQVAGIHVPWSP